MQIKLTFDEVLADVGVYEIKFGEKFYITRSSKIKEWAAKIIDDINNALKPGTDISKLPSRKIIEYVTENNISTAHVSLITESTHDTVGHDLQELLSGNDGNPMCLNVSFVPGRRGPGVNNKPADPDKKKWVPWKHIHSQQKNK